jgi:hypothetical protein
METSIQKKCSKCFVYKTIDNFNKAKTGVYGTRGECKLCQSKYSSEYSKKNKKVLNLKNKVNRKNNPEYYIEYRKNNVNKRKDYIKNRIKNDKLFKLTLNIKNLIRNSFKRNSFSKTSKSVIILGCSIQEFKQHIESKFEYWMTWDNYGNWNGVPTEPNTAWDLDHIIPTSNANTEDELIKLNHYTNIQPLCGYNNRFIKKNNII